MFVEPTNDPLAPARGILFAALGGAALWAALIVLIWSRF